MTAKELANYYVDIEAKVNQSISLMFCDAAGNDIRKLLERICETYLEINGIEIENNLTLSDMLDMLCEYEIFSRQSSSIQNMYEIKTYGNIASHETGSVTQAQVEKIWGLAQNEYRNLMDKMGYSEETINFQFKSLYAEGWKLESDKKYTCIERNTLGNQITEIIKDEIVWGTPEFVDDFFKEKQIPRMSIVLTKRVITNDNLKYQGYIYYDVTNVEDEKLDIDFSVNSETYEVEKCKITYSPESEEITEEVLFLFDKYQRVLEGYWVSEKDTIMKLADSTFNKVNLFYQRGNELIPVFIPLKYYQPYVPFCCQDKWIVLDENNNFCIAKGAQYGLDGNYNVEDIKEHIEINYDIARGNLMDDADSIDNTGLLEYVKDIYRLHYIRNGLIEYFGDSDSLDDYFVSTEEMFVENGRMTIILFDGFELAVQRNKEKCIVELIDTYKNANYCYEVSREYMDSEHTGLMFPYSELAIDYKSLIQRLVTNKNDKLYLYEDYSEEKFVSALKNSLYNGKDTRINEYVRQSVADIEKKKRKVEYEEKIRKEYKEKRRKKRTSSFVSFLVVMAFISPILIAVGVIILILTSPFWIGVAIWVIAAIVAAFQYITDPMRVVNINDYCVVNTTGYNQIGEVTVDIDWDRFEEDYGSKIKYINNYHSTQEGVEAYETFTNYWNYEVDNNGYLSNGDEVTIKWIIDDDAVKERYNYRIVCTDIDYTVDGMQEVELFDPFENISLEYSGIYPENVLNVVVDYSSKEMEWISVTADKNECLKEGDSVTLNISEIVSEEEFLEMFGKLPSKHEKEYAIPKVSRYVTDISEIPEETLEAMDAQLRSKINDIFDGWENESISSITHISDIALCDGDYSDGYDINGCFLVYRIKGSNPNGEFEYIWWGEYCNIAIEIDEKCVYSEYYIPDDKPDQFKLYLPDTQERYCYYGKIDYQTFYSDYIDYNERENGYVVSQITR